MKTADFRVGDRICFHHDERIRGTITGPSQWNDSRWYVNWDRPHNKTLSVSIGRDALSLIPILDRIVEAL